MFCLRGSEFVAGASICQLGLRANLRELACQFLAHPRCLCQHFGGDGVCLLAFTLGDAGAFLGQASRSLGRSSAPIGLGDLRQCLSVRIFDFGSGGLNIPSGSNPIYDVLEIRTEIIEFGRKLDEAVLQGRAGDGYRHSRGVRLIRRASRLRALRAAGAPGIGPVV